MTGVADAVRLLERAALDGHTALRRSALTAAVGADALEEAAASGLVVLDGDLVALEELSIAEEAVAVEVQGLAGEGRLALVLGEVRDDVDALVVTDVHRLALADLAERLQAVPDDAPVVLAGDPDALLGPAAGAALRDLLAWGELEVRDLRPDRVGPGALGGLAAAVRAGRLPATDPADRSLVVVACADDHEVRHRVGQLVSDSIPRALGIPAGEVRVVAPRQRGTAGVAALTEEVAERAAVVTTVHESAWAGGRSPAVVAALGAESAGALSRALVYELACSAGRHLSVVTAAGEALPAAVAQGGHRPRLTRLGRLLGG